MTGGRGQHLLACAALAVAGAACGPTGSGGGGGGGSGFPQPGPSGDPIGESSTQTLDGAGGAFASFDGFLVVEVPPGAAPASTSVTVQEVTNLAPGGVGPAWKLGPEGTLFAKPVALTFYTGPIGRSIDELTVAWQDDQGYWHRVAPGNVARDPVALTLTVNTTHFSSWTVTTTPTANDFTGPISVSTTLGSPFTAAGTITYTFAGEDAAATYYLLSGTLVLPSPLASGTTTCTPTPPETPTFAVRTNVGELSKSTPTTFDWGTSGAWNVSCADGTTRVVSVAFDTVGVGFVGCTRVVTAPEASGPAATGGGTTWDCTSRGLGQVSGTWNLQSAACGTACATANPCKTAAVQCGSGSAVCTETGNVADGSSCGTDQVCSAGVCVGCTAGLACTPANPCSVGVTSCATGASTCVESTTPATPVADGTTCGTDLACSAGVCASCAAGAACTPANPCHQGATSCATGTSVCVDTLATLPDGTGCGSGQVCFAGSCIACTQGAACTSANACATLATYECSSGAPVCTDRLLAAPGTSCGIGLVCSGTGACDSCSAGASCTSTNPCATPSTSTISCASGAPVCVDTVFNAGAPCGAAGQVCTATGQCITCNAGAACIPANPCLAGTLACGSGAPVCVESALPVPNGSFCGTNQVCNAGACVACVADAPCASLNACTLTATTSCSSGSSVCVDRTYRTGQICGTDQVCSPAGTCVACAAGATCTPANRCLTGAVTCGTGAAVCTAGVPVAAGTSCGTGQICSPAGTCVSCVQGATCTPTNPCAATGTTECGSGAPVCNSAALKTDGSICGTGQTCNAGSCVTSRTVTGTYTVTYWPDAGAQAPTVPPGAATAAAAALVSDGRGGWVTYPGTVTPGASSAAVSIPAVPTGPFWLRFREASGNVTYLDTTAATNVDLGYDQLGRAGITFPTQSTPATFQIQLTLAWGSRNLDQVQIVSPSADVWDKLSLSGTVGANLRGNFIDNWFVGNTSGQPLGLLRTGDQTTIVHLQTLMDSNRDYVATWSRLSRSDLNMTSGQPFQPSRTNLAAVGQIALPFRGATWSVGTWNALFPAMNLPSAASATQTLQLGASRGPLTGNAPVSKGNPFLWSMTLPGTTTTTPVIGATLTYAPVLTGLTAAWTTWRGVDFTGSITFLATGAVTGLPVSVSVGQRESPTATTALAPALTPVRNPFFTTSSGATPSALTPATGVGLTPVISWAAPFTGTVTSYTVEIFQLALVPVTAATTSTKIATFVTSATHVAIPTGVLAAGGEYFARITARNIPSDPWSNAPLRRVLAGAWAGLLTGKFTP